MVSFTPLTPNGGTKVDKPTADGSVTSKAAADPSLFGFKGPVASSTSTAFGGGASKGAAASGFGATNPFNSNGSSPSNVFGSTAFGTQSAENKPADSSSASQANKPLFNFSMTGGQSSSSNVSGPQSSNIFGDAKPAPASSSLFGALGAQSTNTFGSTSNLGTNNNVFGSSNAAGNSSATNVFGSQPNQTDSSSQATNTFGNTGAGPSGTFGSTKSAEAPKPVFSPMPTTNGTTSTAATSDPPKSSFQFSNPPQNSTGSSNGALPPNAATGTAPKFMFNFGLDRGSAGSNPPQPSVFGAPTSTPGTQPSTQEAKPNLFSFGSPFAANSASSGVGSIFGSSNSTEQK